MADVNVTTKLQGAQEVLRGFGRITTGIRRVGAAVGAMVGVASVGAFAAMARSVINTADQFAKMSQKVGVSVEDLSALHFQAQITGSSIEEIGNGLRFFNRAMDESAQGVAEYKESFDRLGVSATDNTGRLRPTIDVLEDVAEQFSKMSDGARKTSLAQQLLGRAGSNLIPLLNEGRDGFRRYREEAEKMGLIISTKTAKAAELFNDSMTRVKNVVRGAILQAITPFLEPMAQMAAKFAEVSRESGYLEGIIRTMVTGFKIFATVSATVYAALTIVGKAIAAIGAGLVALIRGDFNQVTAIWEAWKEDARKAVGDLTDVFEVMFAKVTDEMRDRFTKMNKAFEELEEKGGNALDALNAELEKVREEYIKLKDGDAAARQFALTQGKLGEATGKAADKIRDQIMVLDLQIVKLKAAKTEADDLADSQKRQMEEVDKQIQQFYDERRAWEEKAQAIRESVSPLAVYNRELSELNEIDKHVIGGLEEYDEIFERITKKYHNAIEDLQHLSAAERERIMKLREQRKEQIALADELTRAANPMIAYTEAVRTYIFLLNKGLITQETFRESVKKSAETFNAALDKQQGKMEKWQEVMIENMKGFGTEFTKQLDAILAEGENSWRDFRDAIFSLFRRSVLDAFITQPLVEAINKTIAAMKTGTGSTKQNVVGSLGAAAAGYFAGGGGSTGAVDVSKDFAGGFADGGTIRRGFVGLVGEEGPELVVPQGASTVIPSGSTGGVTVNQYFQAGVSRAELASLLPRLKAETVNAIIDAKRRGGKMSRAF